MHGNLHMIIFEVDSSGQFAEAYITIKKEGD